MEVTFEMKQAVESAIGAKLARIKTENGFLTDLKTLSRGRSLPWDGGKAPEAIYFSGDFTVEDEPQGPMFVSFAVREMTLGAAQAAAGNLESDIRRALTQGESAGEIVPSVLLTLVDAHADESQWADTGMIFVLMAYELTFYEPAVPVQQNDPSPGGNAPNDEEN